MSRIFKVLIVSLFITTSSMAGSDGQNELSKNSNGQVKDCFEGINRAVFSFNKGLDNLIIEPIAKGYRSLPAPVRSGTSNVLTNLSSLITIPNNVLQGQIKTAGVNTGRFIINTTVGILGIFDVAEKMGFPEYEKEDYGQTLGVWGVGPGCYLVLPVLGPSTIRDTAGSFINIMGGDPYYNISTHGNNEYLDKSRNEINIYNLIGQSVFSKNFQGAMFKESITIDPSLNGVYFMSVKLENNKRSLKKLIVK